MYISTLTHISITQLTYHTNTHNCNNILLLLSLFLTLLICYKSY